MKLLVFAHPPPPVHGQSVMVQQLLERLPQVAGFEILHVNARLSHDSADIGRARIGKLLALLGACVRAWRLRVRHGPAYFYYIPAPGKRAALYRDFVALLLCRPFFSGLILHWHAVGLGEWLETRASPIERWLARRLLGGAALSVVLAPQVADDARRLRPQRVAVVPNGIPDPASPAPERVRDPGAPCRVLYLGLCSREKGTFDLVSAFARLAADAPGRFQLTLAGAVATPDEARDLRAALAPLPAGAAEWIGFADDARKRALFAAADLFCFPTRYPHEGQPLVLIEALAHDVRIVTTRWRAIPGMLPAAHVWYATPGDPAALATALAHAARAQPPHGDLRRHYLEHFTPERHVAALAAALRSVD
ncbi:MAG: glycosyltransferase family 4 protein [Opitutaceae bacterium]|nr:glycosyltransferase family 4 protein [Opitutaceae bacterium]